MAALPKPQQLARHRNYVRDTGIHTINCTGVSTGDCSDFPSDMSSYLDRSLSDPDYQQRLQRVNDREAAKRQRTFGTGYGEKGIGN